ncbi:response regulator [uncultured Jatrophihabitans sp.]|uniref:response regulator n=1 Tax=uncultured Jatrophihabitans sp. TaxID=1610747 RepID=UPI0035CABECD
MARIVIADNDPDALDLLLLDLRLEGHEVIGATGGDAARRLVDSFAADVVVLDHRMPPGPTGLETALRLRAERPDLRLVIYSNYQSADLVRQAAQHEIRFLPKGNLRTLRAAITA